MPTLVRHTLISPRTWLAIGAFCIGVSFLLGYHLDQRSADRVLAQKVGHPDEVLVQDFIPGRHMNILNEVHTIGQTVGGDQCPVNIGSEDEPRWIYVTPIYAVGHELRPIASAYLNSVHATPVRPMPRDAADGLRRQRLEIEGISGLALAFAIEEAPATGIQSPGTHQFKTLGEVGSDRLVEIAGAVVSGSSLRKTISGALIEHGIHSVPDSLLIAPANLTYTAQSSDAALEGLSWWLAFIGALLALVAMIAPRLAVKLAGFSKEPAPVHNVEASGAFPAIGLFQPIASQDELLREDQRAQARDRARSANGTARLIRRRMSRLADFAASSFGGVRSPR